MEVFNKFLEQRFGVEECALHKLAGDASTREYYRVSTDEPMIKDQRSAVLMHMAEPEPEPLFISVRNVLAKAGVPAPEIFGADHDNGLILLEDFGDVMLEQAVRDATPETWSELYSRAVDVMLDIQFAGDAPDQNMDCPCFHLAFDVEKLMFEMDFFITHVLEIFKGVSFAPDTRRELGAELENLCRTLSDQPRYLCHRDYHSRNLMVLEGGALGVLDFQDARMGPLQYDLVSLIHDSYVDMPPGFADALYEQYLEKLEARGGPAQDREEFRRVYDLMTVQRNLKAAGSFAYLDCVKKMDRYLVRMGPCLEHVRRAMHRLPELDRLRAMLGKYLKELLPE